MTLEGDLASFVERSRAVVDETASASPRTTDLRITLPFLRTLGWDVHGTDLVAEYAVEGGTSGGGDGDGDDGGSEGETVVDYALLVAGRPAVFLQTTGLGESMTPADREQLAAAMAAADVEWGLATSGDVFTFLAGGADGDPDDPREVTCDLEALPDHRSVVARYTREAARRRVDRRRERLRRAAAGDLDGRRETVEAAVADALTDDDLPDPVADELRDAAGTVVERVLATLANGDHPAEGVGRPDDGAGSPDPAPDEPAADGPSASSTGRRDADPAPDDAEDGTGPVSETGSGSETRSGEDESATARGEHGSTTDSGGETTTEGGDEATATSGGGTTRANGEAAPPASDDDATDGADGGTATPADGNDPETPAARVGAASAPGDGGADDEEYVVRFFHGGSSVGAIGHGTSAGALVQAVEYLIANHALDGSLDLPWGPTDDRAVINHEPVHPDGTEMVEAAQLANGYFVCTTIPPEAIREVVEKLADTGGLRVMFQGDW